MGLSRFLKYARLESVESRSGHPFDMPVVSWLSQKRELAFPAGATFLVGENGSGKSTLVEAIAVAAGFKRNCQVVVATHSPILLALPGATILEIGDGGAISHVSYDEALPVRLTREFLAAPERLLRILLEEET
jgi:predicted ATPase